MKEYWTTNKIQIYEKVKKYLFLNPNKLLSQKGTDSKIEINKTLLYW